MPISDRMIWCDLETFGLADTDPIIEYAFVITDLELNVINDNTNSIWTSPTYDMLYRTFANAAVQDGAQSYVYQMHKKSGLWDDARAYGLTPFQAEIEMHDWLASHGIRGGEEPLCGNSVHQDRAWLKASFPRVLDRFHYRNVDVSTLKELCNKFDPDTAADKPDKGLEHRALDDLHETIAEFKHYKGRFFTDRIHREFNL